MLGVGARLLSVSAHVGGARVGRRGQVLTWGRAPQHGFTSLHSAVDRDHLEMARVLLEAGADVTAKCNVSERRVGGEGQRI